ncbi:hypothetical protein PCURB6_24680 [Paenibacillus curdlanolyticus]|nr:hypothetical protein PCURB6_24680 [Paenibacillus curdlanolyticus]
MRWNNHGKRPPRHVECETIVAMIFLKTIGEDNKILKMYEPVNLKAGLYSVAKRKSTSLYFKYWKGPPKN